MKSIFEDIGKEVMKEEPKEKVADDGEESKKSDENHKKAFEKI